MIKIVEKTVEEITSESNEADYYAHMVRGIPKRVSPYYIINEKGVKIDASNLSEEQILGICRSFLLDRKSVSGNIIPFLTYLRKEGFQPSYKGIQSIWDLLNKKEIAPVAADLFGNMISSKMHDVKVIASYTQKSKGNFKTPTKDQQKEVLDQLVKIEEKEKALEKAKKEGKQL